MKSGRKTIDVDQIREWVNTRLAVENSAHRLSTNGVPWTPEEAFRYATASLMEQILHATGNYKGFGYQETEKNPNYVDGAGEQAANWLRDGHDDTRRIYY
jgi:hypothetical protein